VVLSEEMELKLVQESALRPEAEVEARLSVLKRIYSEVLRGYTGRALNRGLLAPLPECVEAYASGISKTPCPEDLNFSYNAIRVLMARYMSRGSGGLYTETPSMVMARVALGFSGKVDPARLYRLLVEGKFVFNSPTLFNMYADGARGTLSACYVTPVYDDMRSIMDAGVVQAMTFKWGGGQGFSFSELRPRWDLVKGTSGYSSGPMSFMQLYDVITEMVKQGGKRRGANMGIMHVWHPDIYTPGFDPYVALRNKLPPQVTALVEAVRRLIEEIEAEGYEVDRELKTAVDSLLRNGWWTIEDAGFIQAKKPPLQDANLTNFNISVGVNDAFMAALLRDDYWLMVNPKYSDRGDGVYRLHYSVSRDTGLGRLGELLERYPWMLENPYTNIYEDVLEEVKAKAFKDMEEAFKARGVEVNVDTKNTYMWRIKARILWDEIVENAWAGGDPGLFYLDNHNKWNPTPWLGVVTATNPCAEQPLCPFESCNLGSFALDKYVVGGVFDLNKFYEDVQLAVDAMDAVIDLNNHPDERHYKANSLTRKIGLGLMGLADALAELGIPYDSDEAVAFTLLATAALEIFAWKRSWELGAELGHAKAFECKRFDWRRFECVESGDPELLSTLHTPALIKAGRVMRVEDGWVKVKYHNGIRIPDAIMGKLAGLSASRVEPDGSLRLVPVDVLESIALRVFGVNREDYRRALKSSPLEVVKNPRLLLALAIYSPERAWGILGVYGRVLGAKAPRNTVATTVAPTGTISILAGSSSGIEPYFALVYKRQVAIGTFLEIVRRFRDDLLALARDTGATGEAITEVYEAVGASKGSFRRALPDLARSLEEKGAPRGFIEGLYRLARKYATTMDFDLWYHIAHQVAAQVYVDQAISKTVNLPRDAPVESVYSAYMIAWLGGLKGFTVYRDESKGAQVIVFGGSRASKTRRLLKKREEARALSRMAIPRRVLRKSEIAKDKRLEEVFEVKEAREGDEVVVQLTENSTCKTCEI
jgi:ribonucleoside-diphosphate reductase alpha chain